MINFIKNKKTLLSLILLFFYISFKSFSAYYYKIALDNLMYKNYFVFLKSALYLILLTILGCALNFFHSLLKNKIISEAVFLLRKNIMKKLTQKEITELYSNNSGKFVSNIINDVDLIKNEYFSFIFSAISDSLSIVLCVLFLLKINFVVTLIIIVMILINFFATSFFMGNISSKTKKYSDSVGDLTVIAKDILNGIEVIKSFNIIDKINEKFNDNNKKVVKTYCMIRNLFNLIEMILYILGYGIYIVAMIVGGYFVYKKIMTIGSIVAIIQLLDFIIGPSTSVSSCITRIKATKPVREKLLNLLKEEVPVTNTSNLSEFQMAQAVKFKNISFSYDKSIVLKNINLNIEKSKKYAIVGPSGSGKSTLIKLLLKYYKNTEGSILIDDCDLNNISLDSLYNNISVIQQNVFMFDSTIEENITLYSHHSEEEINNIIDKVGLTEVKNRLDKENNGLVGENGNKLSGCEKQRVSIARALIKNAQILIMDEATSSLDRKLAVEIEKTILDIEGLTCIIITHRLEKDLLEKYDGIVVLKDGEVSELGNFNELMNNKGVFYSLFTLSN